MEYTDYEPLRFLVLSIPLTAIRLILNLIVNNKLYRGCVTSHYSRANTYKHSSSRSLSINQAWVQALSGIHVKHRFLLTACRNHELKKQPVPFSNEKLRGEFV